MRCTVGSGVLKFSPRFEGARDNSLVRVSLDTNRTKAEDSLPTAGDRREVHMRHALKVAAFLAVVAVAFPVAALGGKPTHTKIDETYADNFCGFDGTTHVTGVDNFKLDGNTFHDTYNDLATFTADNGVVIVIHESGTVGGTFDPVPNGDGTFTVVTTYKGLPEQFKLPHGAVLTRDAGVITLTDTVVPDGDSWDLVNETFTTHGPHPEADSGFELECDILGPILAAGG
jgi:hypothetical protein